MSTASDKGSGFGIMPVVVNLVRFVGDEGERATLHYDAHEYYFTVILSLASTARNRRAEGEAAREEVWYIP